MSLKEEAERIHDFWDSLPEDTVVRFGDLLDLRFYPPGLTLQEELAIKELVPQEGQDYFRSAGKIATIFREELAAAEATIATEALTEVLATSRSAA